MRLYTLFHHVVMLCIHAFTLFHHISMFMYPSYQHYFTILICLCFQAFYSVSYVSELFTLFHHIFLCMFMYPYYSHYFTVHINRARYVSMFWYYFTIHFLYVYLSMISLYFTIFLCLCIQVTYTISPYVMCLCIHVLVLFHHIY